MFNIKIADVSVCIDNKYEYIREMCRDYITDEPAEFSVSVTDDEIKRENDTNEGFPDYYLETLAVYRKIAKELSACNVFLMHGVLMDAENRGILLCAESGTGKSTHAALWLELLGQRCEIINGDKPLVRVIDGVPYAYGTPWCGKEEINKNARVRLSDICFIRRAEENKAGKVDKAEIVQNFIQSIHIPDGAEAISVLDSVDAVARNVKFWNVFCNMDITAAKTAYDAIVKG